jgi:hypothetical protein
MQLTQLVTEASEKAIASMENTQAALIPFTLLLRPSAKRGNLQVTVTKFASELPEQSLQHAQASLKSNAGILMYALAWPSSVTINGRTWEAVLVECGTPDAGEGAIFAQCYERKKIGLFKKKFRILPFGEPFVVSKCTSRLSSSRKSDDQVFHDWQGWVGVLPEQRHPEQPMLL